MVLFLKGLYLLELYMGVFVDEMLCSLEFPSKELALNRQKSATENLS